MEKRITSSVAVSKQEHILAAPDAPEGRVIREHSLWRSESLHAEDVVLCRNTAPLLSVAFRLIAKQVPCHILGKDIGAQLIKLIKSFKCDTREQLVSAIDQYEQKQLSRGESDTISDRCESLRSIIANCSSVDSAIAAVESLFADRTNALTLCTIHKAKGLEWDTVYLLDKSKLMPSRFAKTQEQKEQERNLLYVAITRAKTNLIYVNSKDLK